MWIETYAWIHSIHKIVGKKSEVVLRFWCAYQMDTLLSHEAMEEDLWKASQSHHEMALWFSENISCSANCGEIINLSNVQTVLKSAYCHLLFNTIYNGTLFQTLVC